MMKFNEFRSKKSIEINLCVRRLVSFLHFNDLLNWKTFLFGVFFFNNEFSLFDFELTEFISKNKAIQVAVILLFLDRIFSRGQLFGNRFRS